MRDEGLHSSGMISQCCNIARGIVGESSNGLGLEQEERPVTKLTGQNSHDFFLTIKLESTSQSHSATSLALPIPRAAVSSLSSKFFIPTNSIPHVLSAGAIEKVEDVIYERVSNNDSPSSSIIKVCISACLIIDTAFSKNQDILVHCVAEISRSLGT